MMMSSGDLQLPPGFRFHPTDEELVMHYLCRKCAGHPIAVPIIADIDIYKCDPWELPGMALHGEREWYFFSPRDRKYPNGSRPNRAAGSGYWKATGADKPVGAPRPVGIKKALVFYCGKAPKGEKTNWIMHEYRLADVDRSIRRKNSLRLDDWVLCRIYSKKGADVNQINAIANKGEATETSRIDGRRLEPPLLAPKVEPLLRADSPPPPAQPPQQQVSEYVYLEADSVPRLRAESSCSEQALSSSPGFAWDEVQSQPRWGSWLRDTLNAPAGGEELPTAAAAGLDGDGGAAVGFSSLGQLSSLFRDPPLPDLLSYLQKPF
ncbi:unnamed protein product [Spirodela intermedia]|uniref:NAC domain-containing protein n=1 Tax=Spirodela intermedia TaxID=51605 RepID=A0A7I8KSN6_SPIIN|nr:unnamed protein product [Spirodela intermedia]